MRKTENNLKNRRGKVFSYVNGKITIYGFGYVGKAIFDFLKDHYQIQIIDPKTHPLKKNEIEHTDLAVVCVPTPSEKGGSCDTGIVESVIKNSAHKYYLIKSTIIPGTVDDLVKETGKKIAFSPEFIGEGKYTVPYWRGFPHPTDMKLHQFFIFGGEKEITDMWIHVWQRIAGWAPRYIQTDSTTAEIVKYSENCYLASQKMFFDQLFDIAQAHNRNYNEIRELLLLDGRVSPAMSIIYPESRGFGGKCLPKDVSAIIRQMEKIGRNPHFLKAIMISNLKFQN